MPFTTPGFSSLLIQVFTSSKALLRDATMPQVVYNNDVVVFGTPLLALRVGDAPYFDRRAVYSSGSGTSEIIFEYIVEVRSRG